MSVRTAPPYYYNSAANGNVILRTTVKGNPTPLARPRISRKMKGGHVYSPSSPKVRAFKDAIKDHVVEAPATKAVNLPRKAKRGDDSAVYYGVWLVFNLPRPKYHFIANDPGRRLKEHFSGMRFVAKRPDLDNLVKFVLDGLIGIAIEDDAAVVELHAIKKWDDEDDNEGSTCVLVKKFDTNEMKG